MSREAERVVARWYPASWRDRYGEEIVALLDDTYGDLIDGPGRANLAMSRANRNLVYINRSIYRLIAEETEGPIQQALNESADSHAFFHNQVKIAESAMPTKAEEFRQIATAVDVAIDKSCGEVIALAKSTRPEDKKAATSSMRENCDPALNEAMVSISALTNRILKVASVCVLNIFICAAESLIAVIMDSPRLIIKSSFVSS